MGSGQVIFVGKASGNCLVEGSACKEVDDKERSAYTCGPRKCSVWDKCITASTGQTYALPGQKVAEIKIVTLKTRYSLAEPVKGDGFKIRQIVRVKD